MVKVEKGNDVANKQVRIFKMADAYDSDGNVVRVRSNIKEMKLADVQSKADFWAEVLRQSNLLYP